MTKISNNSYNIERENFDKKVDEDSLNQDYFRSTNNVFAKPKMNLKLGPSNLKRHGGSNILSSVKGRSQLGSYTTNDMELSDVLNL